MGKPCEIFLEKSLADECLSFLCCWNIQSLGNVQPLLVFIVPGKGCIFVSSFIRHGYDDHRIDILELQTTFSYVTDANRASPGTLD